MHCLDDGCDTSVLLRCGVKVKCEIQVSVSRQLEYLRNRELHLLEQVEVVQAAQEELLSQQQDSLHQALGGLHTSLGGAGDRPASLHRYIHCH